jgi:metallophosphoesterase superfamily enzyme
MKDYDGTGVRMPCFVIDPMLLMLPSFGTLTGGYRITAEPNRRIYLVAGTRVIKLPTES